MTSPFTLRPAGPRALLVEFGTLQQVRVYYAEAQRHRAAGILPSGIELVPAVFTLLFDELDDLPAMARELQAWRPAPAGRGEPRDAACPPSTTVPI